MAWQKSSDRELGAAKNELFTVRDAQEVVTNKADVDLDRRHSQMMERLEDEKSRQAENRYQMAVDEDYYDSLQWTEQDAIELISRGQAPLVFNKIKPTINWIMGTEKRTRIDYNVLPREANDEQGAEVKKKLVKYLSDVNNLPWHRSEAFKMAVIAGLGWLEEGISNDPSEEMIFARSENWRNVFHDSRARELDYVDGRYIIRSKVIDVDMLRAMFPDAKGLDGEALDGFEDAQDDIWYLGERLTNQRDFDGQGGFNGAGRLGSRGAYVASSMADVGRREQIRINEGWYTVPQNVKYFATGELRGQAFNEGDEYHQWMLKRGNRTTGVVTTQMRCMLFTEGIPLWDGPSPYKHKKFPLTPLWCYRRARDGMPYGVIRDIRDPQEDLNKRRSKALFILSANRIVMDKGAVEDPEDVRLEAARPDAMIVKKPGLELKFEKPAGEFQGNLELMQNAENFIQEVSGVTSENLGQSTNATSGKAILARQEQGSVVTENLFDNMRFAVQQQGQKLIALLEQFYTEPKVIRIVGNNTPIDWVKINDVDPQTGQKINDITAGEADFVVAEQDFRASLREAAQETMNQLIQTLPPEISIQLLDLVVDLWELPNKEEWLQRIRKVNGQTDPSKKPTPEELLAQQQVQAQQQAQLQLQMEAAQAEVELKKAQAQKAMADAQKAMAEINGQQGNPEAENLQAKLNELQLSLKEAQSTADKLIADAKFAADDRVRTVQSRLDQEMLKAQSRDAEIAAKKEAEIEKAKIMANAQVEAAKITAEQGSKIDDFMSTIKELQSQIKQMADESKKAVQDQEKAIAKLEKDHEKTVAALEKTIEKRTEEANRAVEKVATAHDKTRESMMAAPKASEAAPAGQPMVFNFQIDAATGETTKEITVERDAAGNIKGAKVKEGGTKAKPKAKKD